MQGRDRIWRAAFGTCLARALSQKLNEAWKQPVVVDNRGGANGTIGTALVAKAPADGLTLLIVPSGFAVNPSIYPNLPYDQSKDLAAVSQLASGPLVLALHPSVPVTSVKQLIALAKARPGQLNYASSGNGSPPHIATELFKLMTRIDMAHIPYKGTGPAAVDLLSGQVSLYFMNALSAVPFVKAGRVRAIAVSSPQRSAVMPELPTVAEAGVPGYEYTNWYGLLAPGATPKDAIAKLNREVVRILQLPDVKERLTADGAEVVGSTPEEFAAFLKREQEKFAKVVKSAGITGG